MTWGYWEYGDWHTEGNTSDLMPEYNTEQKRRELMGAAFNTRLNCFPGYEWSETEHRCVPKRNHQMDPVPFHNETADALYRHQPDPAEQAAQHTMRTFGTGATRDNDTNKPDYQGFLSPLALAHFGRYMLKHQKQADGTMRASDNWKKGIPIEAYTKSFIRHTLQFWRAYELGYWTEAEECLDAILFNVMGILHEREKDRLNVTAQGQVGGVA